MLPCDYPFSTSKRGVTRRQTLSPLPSNTKTQKVEAKWKRNNPLPLTEIIIYKGVLSVLVEVEANLPKNFHFVANLEHDSDGGDDVVKVLIGGLGLEAIRLSHIVEADLAVDAYEEMPANLVLDAGL